MFKCLRTASFILILIGLSSSFVFGANSTLQGSVKDAKTGEPLIGANILLLGTGMGAATNTNGNYNIQNVLPGSYTVRASYIGYKSKEVDITIKEGQHIQQNFVLEPVGVESKTVVVTAQASGQSQAINQQLSSNQIINVVSAAKIQELPDANAAESVGRLPGISVLRSGGEGYAVVIRGLQPKYNRIMIDGIQMSSSDPNNRSTDLSMISSNMLEGIQVSKTVTPDMDADVIGGTVNFELREARVKQSGVPQFGLLVQGSYNNLSNAYNKFNNYKYVGSAEDRFFDNKFGVFAQIEIERKNLSSNELGASYTHAGNSITQYWTSSLTLHDIPRDRQRYNGALVMDYKLPNGRVKLENFLSSGSTYIQNRAETFGITNNTHDYSLTSSKSVLNTITNGIHLEQQLPVFHMDLRLSHAYSETKHPNDWSIDFLQSSAGLNQFSNVSNVNPQDIPKASNNLFSNTFMQNIDNSNSFSRERILTAKLDLKTNLNLSDAISAELKFGGKYQYLKRSYMFEQYNGQSANGGSALFVDSLIEAHFSLPLNTSTGIPMTYFIDPNFNYGTFLGGDYSMVAPLNQGMLSGVLNLLNNNLNLIAQNNGAVTYARNNYTSTTSNYSGHEDHSAFYIMSIINLGSRVTLIPGVRYQNLKTTYTGVRGIRSPESFYAYNHYDTTTTQVHDYWLPDISLRYKPLPWFDVRLSYTNTLSYPDFNAIIPRIDMASNSIGWINYKLIPSRSTNYDAYLSFYDNNIGLFTVGGFLKRIDNLIYPWSFFVSGEEVLHYLPYSLIQTFNPYTTYNVYTFVNDSYRIDDYGIELDWQTHFWYLPGPLSGLVFSANYTHILSKAEYPYTYTLVSGRSIKHIDTSFTARLLYQPDDIVNLSLGFDYKGFSIRVSMLYQSDIFTGPDFWPQLRSHTVAYRRWDLSAKQDLPWPGLQIYGNVNNINGANDISVIEGGGVPISQQDYGLTADLGLRFKF